MPEIAPHTGLPAGDPIHRAAYRYRQAGFLVLAVGLLGVFLPGFVRFAWECTGAGRPLDERLLLVVPTVIFGALAFMGGLFLWHYIRDHAIPLVIDASGVRYGRKHLSWAEIDSLRGQITGRRWSGMLQLVLRRRGRLFFGPPLTTTPGLSPAECADLMGRLQREITPVHGHLKFTCRD